jgi:hypothetical protein
MTSELDRIKFKIKALAAKTISNGCSEHEALSAMEGVGRLLSQYNLTMEECDVRESACKTIYMNIGRIRRHPIDSCIVALANLVGAKVWFQRRWNKHGRLPSAYAFFGQENDLELAEYLFKVIYAAVETEAAEFKQSEDYRRRGADPGYATHHRAGFRRTAYVAFQRGMACRIHVRLTELKAMNDLEMQRYRQGGTALLVLKGQLVDDEFKRSKIKLQKDARSYCITDPVSFEHGSRAGDKVNLSRPLKKDGKATKGLLE